MKYFVIGCDPSSPEYGICMPVVEAKDAVEAIDKARRYLPSIEFCDAVDSQRLRELAECLENAQAEISSDVPDSGGVVDASHRCGGECCGWCASRKAVASADASVERPCGAAQSKARTFKVQLVWSERYGVEAKVEASSPEDAADVALQAMQDGSFYFPTDIGNFRGTEDAHVASVVELGVGGESDDPHLFPLEKYCDPPEA